jgi:magnesium chelatase family protein
VLAANPCPCGNYSNDPTLDDCRCAERVRRAYRAKLSGPIVDRIDITRHVRPAKGSGRDDFRPPESSAAIATRVAAARARQHERFAGCSWRLNSQVPSPRLKDAWPVLPDAQALIDQETYRGRLSARGAVRVVRMAWTVADLASVRLGTEIRPGIEEVDVALRLRAGQPLDLRAALEEAAG